MKKNIYRQFGLLITSIFVLIGVLGLSLVMNKHEKNRLLKLYQHLLLKLKTIVFNMYGRRCLLHGAVYTDAKQADGTYDLVLC